MIHHAIVQLVYDELCGMRMPSQRGQMPASVGLSEQGQHSEEGQASCRSPEHHISHPMGLKLSSERKDRNTNTGVGSWAEPAHRKAGRAARRICNPQE